MTIKRLIASLGMTGIATAVIPMAQAQEPVNVCLE